jgi:hypothetical protein
MMARIQKLLACFSNMAQNAANVEDVLRRAKIETYSYIGHRDIVAIRKLFASQEGHLKVAFAERSSLEWFGLPLSTARMRILETTVIGPFHGASQQGHLEVAHWQGLPVGVGTAALM